MYYTVHCSPSTWYCFVALCVLDSASLYHSTIVQYFYSHFHHYWYFWTCHLVVGKLHKKLPRLTGVPVPCVSPMHTCISHVYCVSPVYLCTSVYIPVYPRIWYSVYPLYPMYPALGPCALDQNSIHACFRSQISIGWLLRNSQQMNIVLKQHL